MDFIGDWYTLNRSRGLVYECSSLANLSWIMSDVSTKIICQDQLGSKIAVFDQTSSRLRIFNGLGQLLRNQLWKPLVAMFFIDDQFVCVHEDHKIQVYDHDLRYLGKISNSEIDFHGIESAELNADGQTFIIKTRSGLFFKVNVAVYLSVQP